MTGRTEKIVVGDEKHIAHFTTYADGTENAAIQTYDEFGLPYCRPTCNPGYKLDDNIIAVRDDKMEWIGETVQALESAGLIEKLQPVQQIEVGFATATLYKIIE